MFEAIYNLIHMFDIECGRIVKTALVYHGLASISVIVTYFSLVYYKIQGEYSDLKNMDCNRFYCLSSMLILSTGIWIVSSLLGEVNFL